jgi:hypothetical protein
MLHGKQPPTISYAIKPSGASHSMMLQVDLSQAGMRATAVRSNENAASPFVWQSDTVALQLVFEQPPPQQHRRRLTPWPCPCGTR